MIASLLAAGLLAAAPPGACASEEWPLWERYAGQFLSGDGRVIDRTDGDKTTSEGQSYALFFSLVANDRARFDRVLDWTRVNLAQGDLARHLPAWKWGRDTRQRWRVLDANSASDADLWSAYALLEAGRLWGAPRYEALGRALLAQVRAREVAQLPGLGPMLLPGARGFEIARGSAWRLNPSYLPPPLLRRFASAGVPGPWGAILEASARMLLQSTPHGLVADWVAYRKASGFTVDPVTGPLGSYDAIRVYLWATLTPEGDPLKPIWQQATRGLLESYRAQGQVPERVDVVRGEAMRAPGPPGFVAVARLLAAGEAEAAALDAALAASRADGLFGTPPRYYDQNLVLFALGYSDGRYRFGADGGLVPAWEAACAGR